MSRTLKPPIRVTIAQVMWAIAGIAVVCAWPWLLVLIVPIGLFALALKPQPFYVEVLVVVAIIAVLAGLILPAVQTS